MELAITTYHECSPQGKWMSNMLYTKQTGVSGCGCCGVVLTVLMLERCRMGLARWGFGACCDTVDTHTQSWSGMDVWFAVFFQGWYFELKLSLRRDSSFRVACCSCFGHSGLNRNSWNNYSIKNNLLYINYIIYKNRDKTRYVNMPTCALRSWYDYFS